MGAKSSTKKYFILVIIAMAIIIILLSGFILFNSQIQGILPNTKVSTPTPTPYYVPVPTPTPYYAPIPTPTLSLPTSKPDFTITNVQTPKLCYQDSVSFVEGLWIKSTNNFGGQIFITYSWIGTHPAGVIVTLQKDVYNELQDNILLSPNNAVFYGISISQNMVPNNYGVFIISPIPSIGDYTLQITCTGNGISHSVNILLEIYSSS